MVWCMWQVINRVGIGGSLFTSGRIYMALLLRSINERRDMSAIVNETLESYLNGAPSRPVAQAPGRPGVPQGINQGVRVINDQSPINGEDWLTSNPWVRIIRSRYGS